MNSKMTTNSQPKRKEKMTKTKQTTRTGTESEKGHHMEGFQWGGGREEWEGRYREEEA